MIRSLSTAVLLLLLALPGVALAQGVGTLAGRVIDAETNEPLPGANVRIGGTSLGAATNADGNYRIIGVPVGSYDITASFAGFVSKTETGVSINSGLTRELSFELGTGSLGIVEVIYERPVITSDAIGNTRYVSAEDLENLPIRGVTAVAATSGGTVNSDGSGTLNIRGGRGEEVEYYVDGVRVQGLIAVNQQAIQEQEVLIGTIPARYGDVQSGVISITTKTGRSDFFGSAELLTSEVLDSYGYNLGSLSLGGPIVPGRVGFFASAEYSSAADNSPYGIETYRLNDATYNDLQLFPQVLEVRDADGNSQYIPFPTDLITRPAPGATTGISVDSLATILGDRVPEGYSIVNGALIDRAETFTASDFETVRGKDDPLKSLTFNGNLNFDIGSVNLRVGGGFATREANEFIFSNSLYNRDVYNIDRRDQYRMFGTLRQRIGTGAFYQIQGEFQDFQYSQRPNGFAEDGSDLLSYGDVDNALAATSRRYFVLRNGVYDDLYGGDSGSRPVRVQPGTFSLPGRVNTTNFQKSHDRRLRFTGSATQQVGVNQIEFGGEYQQDTRRFYSINAAGLAAYVNDADGPSQTIAGFPDGITSYDQLPFETLRNSINYYGYNYLGLAEVNDQSIEGFFPDASGNRSNTNIDAYRPRYYAGYIQDKVEFSDLIVQLGMRVDVFDNNTIVLKDIYAPTPIQRAGTIAGRPAGIGSDYAVYFNGDNVVGYRDLAGNFFDVEGSSVSYTTIIQDERGQVIETDEALSTAFTEYEPKVTVMPRLGVSFPVTDRALFFASYNVVSQRPTENAFATIATFEELTGQNSRTNNPTLEPEKTTQYELGFRQRLGERAALSLSGFYRTQENKISNRTLYGGFPAYGTYLNTDFTTTQGVEVNFDLRRTKNLAITTNYTLSFAAGTGSDAGATSNIVWRGDYFPQFISPADFDQRHTVNASLDYRFGKGEGPMVGGIRPFQNFGVNILGQFGSGQKYTRLAPNNGFSINDSFTEAVDGNINGADLPGNSRFDLRVDRAFDLGFQGANLRAYLTVTNLLDTKNVYAVYRGTGLPNQDGYASTSAGTNALNTPGRLFHYQAYAGGPVNVGGNQSSGGSFYGQPRQVRVGFLFDF